MITTYDSFPFVIHTSTRMEYQFREAIQVLELDPERRDTYLPVAARHDSDACAAAARHPGVIQGLARLLTVDLHGVGFMERKEPSRGHCRELLPSLYFSPESLW